MNIWKTLFNFTPLGRLFGGRAKNIGSGLSSVASLIRENDYVGSFVNSITGAGLTGAEREANAFTAAQAELGRQWQEDMYNKYESPTAMMNQYREAGLNPALMYGDASSGSVGTNAGAGSSVSPGSSPLDFAQLLMSLAGLKSEISLRDAQAENLREEAVGRRINNNYADFMNQARYASILADTEKVFSEIDKNKAEVLRLAELTRNDVMERGLIEAQISNEQVRNGLLVLQKIAQEKQNQVLDYDILREEFAQEYRHLYGSEVSSPWLTQLLNVVLTGVGRATGEISPFN